MSRTSFARKTMALLRLAIAKEMGLINWTQIDQWLEFGAYQDVRFLRNLVSSSRRDFLSRTGQAIMGSAFVLSACKTSETRQLENKLLHNNTQAAGKVVIVGGGAAGLTAAYRLLKAGIKTSIYEAADRLGGRTYTEYKFNGDGMFCERGGELVDTIHHDLISLCVELGLEIEDVIDDSSLVRDLFFFGGRVQSEKEVIQAFEPMAKVIVRDLKAITVDGQVFVPTYSSLMSADPATRRLDRTSLAEYIEGIACEIWLRDLIEITYLGMFGSECSEQSSLNLLTLINPSTQGGLSIYGDSNESKRIKGGSENLPRALVKSIRNDVPILTQHRLMAIREQGMTFQLDFDQNGKTISIKADRVILALPLSVLRLVDLSGLDLSATKKLAINEWGYGTNTKFMMGFKSRPWRTGPKRSSGSVYTDLPSQCFWETSAKQAGTSGIITNFLGGRRGASLRPGQIKSAFTDLEAIFPGTASEFDGKRLLQHWPSHPFSLGSYTCLRPGQYTTIYGSPGEAELGGRLQFAGEHCSIEFSGYMNGAVQSGNLAAKNLLKSLG